MKAWTRRAPIWLLLYVAPFLMVISYALLLYIPSTKDFALSLRGENNPIEMITFITLFIAFLYGIYVIKYVVRVNKNGWITLFYLLFTLGAFFTAMEEIAWGQWFFGFETPAALAEINMQGEVTIHNLPAFQGQSEYLRVFFGLAGLMGIYMGKWQSIRLITPTPLLLPWFLAISILAIPDLYIEFYPDSTHAGALFTKASTIGWYFNIFSEFVEMLIGMTALIYIIDNHRSRILKQ